jgi:CheY-like chemotaxis protein
MPLKGKHIFIVEDNVGNRSIILTILEMAGAKTSFDQWGNHAVSRLKKAEKVDMILMDLMLPNGLTGYDVYDQIKAIPELADIPIVIVSASDPNVEMKKARDKGFQGFIPKPINYNFPVTLATILAGQRIWGYTVEKDDPNIQKLLAKQGGGK